MCRLGYIKAMNESLKFIGISVQKLLAFNFFMFADVIFSNGDNDYRDPNDILQS